MNELNKDSTEKNLCLQKMTVTSTNATLTGLQTNELYNIFVVSKNGNGTSLPSSVLLVNITDTGECLAKISIHSSAAGTEQ